MQNITYKYNKLFGNTKAVLYHMEARRAPGAKMIDRQRHMQTACSPLAARGFCNLLCIRKMTARHDVPHIYQNIKQLGDCPAVPAMQDNHATSYQPSSYTERSHICSFTHPPYRTVPTRLASPVASPIASPVASPIASPVASHVASPVTSHVASHVASTVTSHVASLHASRPALPTVPSPVTSLVSPCPIPVSIAPNHPQKTVPHNQLSINKIRIYPAVLAMQDNHTTSYQPSSYTEHSKQKIRRGQRNRDKKQ